MKVQIKDVKIGDKIYGTDGKWHKVLGKTEIEMPCVMYEITFSNGVVRCSDTHLWNVYVNGKRYLTDAMGLEDKDKIGLDKMYLGCHIGTKDGPTLVSLKRIPQEPVQCLVTDAPDNQFLIYTEDNHEQNE